MSRIYIEYRKDADYPKEAFGPACSYPEYRYGNDTLQEKNDIYDMVRQCLIGLGYDSRRVGSKEWNPLGEIIHPGDYVVIKPNWVMHYNGARNVSENALECLVTHPSCLRAICDYCLIALDGKGQILIGDAPMQDCDLPQLMDEFGYNKLLDFYKSKNENVKLADFRKYQSVFDKSKVIVKKIYQSGVGIDVKMGALSMHEKRQGKRVYQVDNYNVAETKEYHNDVNHIYSINKDVLEANVIINFCKPKSHRLAGFTAAMKNMVGIAYNKASLPHRVEGSVAEGGDSYRNASKVKKIIDMVLDRKIKNEEVHHILRATLDRYLYGVLLIFSRKLCKDPYIKGIWHGNDTIWRTVADLNYIVRFADQRGELKTSPQRKILNFGDMIIAGHHNGPCQPEPKKLGVLIASEDALAMDLAICKMIGFPENKIPMINAICNHEMDYLFGQAWSDYELIWDNKKACLNEADFPSEWKYQPHDAWKDIL